MTLTVRLKPELESALESHCAERGVTKSLVVQEVLAEYLARPPGGKRPNAAAPDWPDKPSETYLAFKRLGLIGTGALDGRSATKEVVRERIQQNFERKRARRA
jgi:hypothetical protein